MAVADLFKRAGVVALLLFFGTTASASGAEAVDASAKAIRALLEKGNKAAQKERWLDAANYYLQAQKRAFFSPQIMYNLALAESKSGNELLADIWFRAYLGAMPDAANAELVEKEIARLEKVTEAKMERLFQQAEQLAKQLPIKGETANAEGRRAQALVSIGRCRAMVGDFKGAEEDGLHANRVSGNGRTIGDSPEGSDWKNRIFAEALADAGDVDGAILASEKIKNENHRNSIRERILWAVARSGDLQKAKKLLENNYSPESYYLWQIAEAFAKNDDDATAESLAKKEKGTPYVYVVLAQLQLSKGNISEAIRYARSAGKSAEAMAIRGEVEAAFQRLMDNEETSAFQPINVVYTFNSITKDLIYLGDFRNAQTAAELAVEWIDNDRKYLSEKRYAKAYAQLAKAYLDVDKGEAANAIKRIAKIADALSKISTSKFGQEAYREARDLELRRDICDFAISRGKLEVAEYVADSFSLNREQIGFLKKILRVHKTKSNQAEAERLSLKLAGLAAEAHLGWENKNPGREIIVNAWLDAADALSQELAVRDLLFYLSEARSHSPESLPADIAYAASKLGLGLLKIRALGKIYR